MDIERLQDALGLAVRRDALRAAQVLLAGLPLARRPLRVDAALLERLHVEQARCGIVRRREPVGSSILRRADAGSLRSRFLIRILDRSPVGADRASPREISDE